MKIFSDYGISKTKGVGTDYYDRESRVTWPGVRAAVDRIANPFSNPPGEEKKSAETDHQQSLRLERYPPVRALVAIWSSGEGLQT